MLFICVINMTKHIFFLLQLILCDWDSNPRGFEIHCTGLQGLETLTLKKTVPVKNP